MQTRWNLSESSWSNWNLEMLVFRERGKPEYPEKNLSEQGRQPTTNSTPIWRQRQDSNLGHIGGRRALSPLRHSCSLVRELKVAPIYTGAKLFIHPPNICLSYWPYLRTELKPVVVCTSPGGLLDFASSSFEKVLLISSMNGGISSEWDSNKSAVLLVFPPKMDKVALWTALDR